MARITFPFLVLLFYSCCNAQHPETLIKSVILTTSNTMENGVNVVILDRNVTTVNNDHWTLDIPSSMKSSNIDQIGWDMLINLNESWGFHPLEESTIKLTIYSDQETGGLDKDIIISFSVDNSQYISIFLTIDNKYGNAIYPICGESLASGNINDIVNSDANIHREDKAFGGNCCSAEQRLKPEGSVSDNYYPLTFIIRNNPNTNRVYFTLSNPHITQYPDGQNCEYKTSFITGKGLQIYIGSDEVNDEAIDLKQFKIEYVYNSTYSPTHIPTSSPSNIPTPSPTDIPTSISIPTNIPTPLPSNIPTSSPSNIPTPSPTNIPIPSPTNIPTPSPTNIPTSSPSNIPTPLPSNNPTPSPTDIPTSIPTNIPSKSPSNNPTPSPIPSPTQNPAPFLTQNHIPSPTKNPFKSSTNTSIPLPTENSVSSPTTNPTPSTLNPTKQPSMIPTISITHYLTLNEENSESEKLDIILVFVVICVSVIILIIGVCCLYRISKPKTKDHPSRFEFDDGTKHDGTKHDVSTHHNNNNNNNQTVPQLYAVQSRSIDKNGNIYKTPISHKYDENDINLDIDIGSFNVNDIDVDEMQFNDRKITTNDINTNEDNMGNRSVHNFSIDLVKLGTNNEAEGVNQDNHTM